MATGGNGSDEIINFKCCICANKNITREAENYCVECQDYYCTSCTDLHKLFPSAIGVHQFIDKTNFSTAGAQTVLPSFPTERCVAHKSKLLDMYCADHDEIVCTTCVALNHRTCKDMHSVPDELDSLYEKSAADETKELLLATKAKMEDVKKTKEHLAVELDKYKNKAAESIKHFRKEMEDVLDRLERESHRNLEEINTKMRKTLEDEIKAAQQYIDELRMSMEKVSKSFGNKAQEFVSVKTAKKCVFGTTGLAEVLTKAFDVEISFTADSKIKAFMNELKALGIISSSTRSTLYKVKRKNEVNIRHANDKKKCNVYGSCFTSDGFLLLADQGNRTLKRVDLSSGSIKDQLVLEASPVGVCQTGQDNIAVSLSNQSIQFVSLKNGMTAATQQLKLNHNCWGLAYKDSKLYVTDSGTSLYIHDINGSLQQEVTTNQQGNGIFWTNRHISLSSHGDKIYVADYHKGVITLDLQGNHELACTDPVVTMWGICTDGRGNMFTCGFGQSNIVQLNEKTKKKLGMFGAVTGGQSACFDPEKQHLVVTSGSRDTIDIYELE